MNRFRNLLGALFIVATLLGAMHHHDDFKSHSDCQVCTLQLNLSSGDIPTEPIYLQELSNYSEKIITEGKSLHVSFLISNVNARAPPFNS
ncbi:hypothetical protein KKA17_09545 [bacterium]|nr:hypothetical protein [bacterium]MBU1884547.1 hypothetical protein [bacterium]